MFHCRFLLICSLMVCTGFVYGQNLSLVLSNPAPRVGDEISASFTVQNGDDGNPGDYIKLGKGVIGIGAFTLSQSMLSETGQVKIGPFSIALNDKTFTTDALTVKVYPQLPADVREGIWIRQGVFQERPFVIIEQRAIDGNRKAAELDLAKCSKAGMNFQLDGTQQSTQSTLLGSVNYRITIYQLASPVKTAKVDKTFFTGLTGKTFFEE